MLFGIRRSASLLRPRLLGALAGLVIGLFSPFTQAQVLVDNTGNANSGQSEVATFGQDIAEGFTTGAQATVLTNVAIRLAPGGGGTGFTLSIFSDAAGAPGNAISTLTGPPNPTTGQINQYAGGVPLAANTPYWVVASCTMGTYFWADTADLSGSVGAPITIGMSDTYGVNWRPLPGGGYFQLAISLAPPPPVILPQSIVLSPTSGLSATIQVSQPTMVTLQSSPDLVNWTTLQTYQVNPPGTTFTDPVAGQVPAKYYRLLY